MIRIVIRDATGTEKEADMNELNEPLCKHEIYTSRCQICGGAEPMNATVSDKPKRARHRVATKTTVTKTVEKELTFTEADLRRMLRIPEGAILTVTSPQGLFEDTGWLDGHLVATWTVKK